MDFLCSIVRFFSKYKTIEIEPESLTCILPAHPRHQIIRELQEIQDKIIFHKYQEAKNQVLTLLEKTCTILDP